MVMCTYMLKVLFVTMIPPVLPVFIVVLSLAPDYTKYMSSEL